MDWATIGDSMHIPGRMKYVGRATKFSWLSYRYFRSLGFTTDAPTGNNYKIRHLN